MAYLGQINRKCDENRPKTGKGRCDRLKGLITGLIIADSTAMYPLDAEQFKAGLEGWINADGIMRMMPISGVFANTPSGGEVNTSQVGYGPTVPLPPSLMMQGQTQLR